MALRLADSKPKQRKPKIEVRRYKAEEETLMLTVKRIAWQEKISLFGNHN